MPTRACPSGLPSAWTGPGVPATASSPMVNINAITTNKHIHTLNLFISVFLQQKLEAVKFFLTLGVSFDLHIQKRPSKSCRNSLVFPKPLALQYNKLSLLKSCYLSTCYNFMNYYISYDYIAHALASTQKGRQLYFPNGIASADFVSLAMTQQERLSAKNFQKSGVCIMD